VAYYGGIRGRVRVGFCRYTGREETEGTCGPGWWPVSAAFNKAGKPLAHINKEKSSVVFSKNTRPPDKQSLMTVLDISTEARNDRYLGLPVYMGRSKTQTFA
jgi:hypothetical protein